MCAKGFQKIIIITTYFVWSIILVNGAIELEQSRVSKPLGHTSTFVLTLYNILK